MDELAPIIAAAASSSPGFTEHASELSQQDLEHWAERWARCSLRKNCAPRSPEVSSDKHHNRRLFLQSRAVLTKLWRSMGSAAASFSQRFVADQTGLNRKTLRLHWDYWLQLVAGPHPSLTGGGQLRLFPLVKFSIWLFQSRQLPWHRPQPLPLRLKRRPNRLFDRLALLAGPLAIERELGGC